MTPSSRATRPPAARPRAPARRKPLNTFAPPDHDPLSDSRLRPLVERYASLAGATLDEVGPQLFELRVPEEDHCFFDGRERVLVAFAVAALERSPDGGEMAVIGSPFVEQLLAAIRARGARLSLGMVTSGAATDAVAAPALSVPVRNGTTGAPTLQVARHPIGRLLARVLIRAGASVEEHLVEGGFFDLAAGAPLPRNVAESCAAAQQAPRGPAKPDVKPGAKLAPARPAAELVELMVADLRARLAPRVEQLRADAERALAAELDRIDKYYRAMLADAGAKQRDEAAMAEAGRAIEAEHARRRVEEERRHQVRAVVHPLQMVEMEMVVQQAVWTLSAAKGRRATLSARRFLTGSGAWVLSCPTCARAPSALLVCQGNQIACESCADECSVCGEGFRASDDTARCHVDEAPACADHARTCSSCGRHVCTAHEGDCAEGAHRACASCLAPCALCGRAVCASHAVASGDGAPMGSRRLCARCAVHCEGRRSEPVGRDEAAECATCERFVCETHQATCDLDGNVHCSTHLARTDQSRRLLCEAHRSACAHEPDSIFATDEVTACPVCARPACPAHARECTNCGRQVCVGEWEATTSRCATCGQMALYATPSAAELAAAADATAGAAPEPKKWRAARDATHLVVEMSQGWRRRIVFAVRHAESRAETAMSHTARGSRRTR